MDELRVGLVGAGMVAAHHLAGWNDVDGAQIAGVADPDSSRSAKIARDAQAPAFKSLAAMVEQCELDAVDIVAPVAHHAALIQEAVNSGLHVLCQKPLAQNANKADALIRSLPDSPRVMVHENWRWRAPYRKLSELLAEGVVAKPSRFEMRVESAGLLPDEKGYYPALLRQPFFADLPRLLVFEVLIHHLDTLAFLFGPLQVTDAVLKRRCSAIAGEDYARIGLLAGDVAGTLIGDFCRRGASPLPGDTLSLDDEQPIIQDSWTLALPRGGAVRTNPASGYQASYTDTIRHFVECIRMGRDFETPAAQGAFMLGIVDRIYDIAAS